MIWLTHIDFRLAPGKVHWYLPNHLMFIIVVAGSIWPFFSLFSNNFMSPMSETFYSKLFSPNKTIFCFFLIPMLWELCRIKNESGERLSPWNMFLLILSSTETYLFADNSGLSLLMLSKTKQVMLSDKRYIFSHYLIYHGKLNLKFPLFSINATVFIII